MTFKKLISLFLVRVTLGTAVCFAASTATAAAMKIYGIDVSSYQGTIDWAKEKHRAYLSQI